MATLQQSLQRRGGKLQPRVFLEKPSQQHGVDWHGEHTNTRNIKNGEKNPTNFVESPSESLRWVTTQKVPKISKKQSQKNMTGLFLLVLSKFFYFAKKRNVNPPNKKKFKNITQKNERTW